MVKFREIFHVLKLTQYHAKRHDTRNSQVKYSFGGLAETVEEDTAEYCGPVLDYGTNYSEGKTHGGGKPEDRGSRIVHSHLFVSQEELCQAPTKASKGTGAEYEDQTGKYEVCLGGHHQENAGKY